MIHRLMRFVFGVMVMAAFLVASGMYADSLPVVRTGFYVALAAGAAATVLAGLAKLLQAVTR
jgi:hypothetical protein